MPKPQLVVRQDGTKRWKVRYRRGQTNGSESFVEEKAAKDFCKLVDAVGGARAHAIINEHEKPKVVTHTLNEVIDLWWEWKSATRPDGTPLRVGTSYTLTRYEQIVRLHIRPHLGKKYVNLLTEAEVQDWVDRLAGERSPKLCADAHSLLHEVYVWAAAKSRGLAIIDPCTETSLPKKPKKSVKGFTRDELKILLRAALEVDPHAADLLAMMQQTGWRWSEIVALRSQDIDDYGDIEIIDDSGERRIVPHVVATMGRVLRREGTKFEFVEDDAKSQAGIRAVRLGVIGSAIVRRRRAGLRPTDLLLTTRKGTRWSYSSFHSDIWTLSKLSTDGPRTRKRILQIAQENGLERAAKAKIHWLRHTHSGVLLQSGEPMAAVGARIGHADIRTTVNVYGSLVSDVSQRGLDALDGAISDAWAIEASSHAGLEQA